jgi:hypothetical protein
MFKKLFGWAKRLCKRLSREEYGDARQLRTGDRWSPGDRYEKRQIEETKHKDNPLKSRPGVHRSINFEDLPSGQAIVEAKKLAVNVVKTCSFSDISAFEEFMKFVDAKKEVTRSTPKLCELSDRVALLKETLNFAEQFDEAVSKNFVDTIQNDPTYYLAAKSGVFRNLPEKRKSMIVSEILSLNDPKASAEGLDMITGQVFAPHPRSCRSVSRPGQTQKS